jgi:hypothetical protein
MKALTNLSREFTQAAKLLTTTAVILLTCAAAGHAYAGRVALDDVSGQPGETVAMELRLLSNDSGIAGMHFPLHFDNRWLEVVDVSFEGSIIPADFTAEYNVANTGDSLNIFVMAPWFEFGQQMATIDDEAGLVATIYFAIDSLAPGAVVTIDSVRHPIPSQSGVAWLWVNFSDADGFMLLPEFKAGTVTIDSPTDVTNGPHDMIVPNGYVLEQNYPNPFNPTTTIEFSVERRTYVNLSVFNILGQPVETLVDATVNRGLHRVEFDASAFPSGVYFYRLSHADGVETRKMLLLK